MIVILDSSAVVEIMRGSEKGEKARKILEIADVIILPAVVIAELTSYAVRNGIDTKFVEEIERNSIVANIDSKIAKEAGKYHASRKKIQRGISLADCTIIAIADEYGGTIITTDHHFKLYKGKAIIIE